jgi:putative ABC transport system permease protein
MVPEQLLRQAQRTREIFNIVLGAIASISLVVGGIGIMNIMLASVNERTREIGLRKAVGARPRDILAQFLIESAVLSILGGLAGVLLTLAALVAARWASPSLPLIITPWAVALAVTFSAATGIFFGVYPARRASHFSPIEALRNE